MNANDVLIDLLEDNRRRLHRLFAEMDDACLAWRPYPEANNIAVTVWHMARIFDVFLTRQVQGLDATAECWFRYSWAQRTGYDPRGIGLDGLGMLTGYTPAEVTAVPILTKKQLLAYLDEVYDAVHAYLGRTTMDQLQAAGAGFDGKYSQHQCIQMALLDNVWHLGEIFALHAGWQR